MTRGVQADDEGTSIRRRPPMGVDSQPCGPVAFRVETDDANAPRNILEEIVWSKAAEIENWRLLTPAPILRAQAMQVREAAGRTRKWRGRARIGGMHAGAAG
jgi:indole-3-glycerol phosphate synthase